MAMAVMIESVFAFLTAKNSNASRLQSSSTSADRGGAFHFFFDREEDNFRTVTRCFFFALPICAMQIQTGFMLYMHFRKYQETLRTNAAVSGRLEGTTRKDPKFDMSHYSHPKVASDADINDEESDPSPLPPPRIGLRPPTIARQGATQTPMADLISMSRSNKSTRASTPKRAAVSPPGVSSDNATATTSPEDRPSQDDQIPTKATTDSPRRGSKSDRRLLRMLSTLPW